MTSTRGRPRYDDILTPREWQVVDLLEQGLTNEQIAERLQISFGGAKFHVAEIISKLGAEDRHEAVRLARSRQRRRAGLLAWMMARLRFSFRGPSLVGGAAAVAVLAALLFLGALLTNWFTFSSGGSNEDDPAAALSDFESGGSQHDFLAQAQFDPDGCVTGEEARNPRSPPDPRAPSGLVMPFTKNFKTIEEAERFLCVPLPRPRASGLRLHDKYASRTGPPSPVRATRPNDLETLINAGRSRGIAEVYYRWGTGGEIQFRVVPNSGIRLQIAGMETAQAVTIQGTEGKLVRTPNAYGHPDSLDVAWARNGYSFEVTTEWLDDFDLQKFLAILETVS